MILRSEERGVFLVIEQVFLLLIRMDKEWKAC